MLCSPGGSVDHKHPPQTTDRCPKTEGSAERCVFSPPLNQRGKEMRSRDGGSKQGGNRASLNDSDGSDLLHSKGFTSKPLTPYCMSYYVQYFKNGLFLNLCLNRAAALEHFKGALSSFSQLAAGKRSSYSRKSGCLQATLMP